MKRNLILSGGVAHDYCHTFAMLAEILVQADIRSEICEDFQHGALWVMRELGESGPCIS